MATSLAELTSSSTPKSIDYGRFTPLIIKSVQELKAANDNLVSETAALKAQLKAAMTTRPSSNNVWNDWFSTRTCEAEHTPTPLHRLCLDGEI